MHAIVETKRAEVAEVCRRSGVVRLEVFGSAARGDFDASRSDLDFIVRFGLNPASSAFDSDFALKDALEQVFGKPVDLVSDGAVCNPFIMAELDRDRQPIYAA